MEVDKDEPGVKYGKKLKRIQACYLDNVTQASFLDNVLVINFLYLLASKAKTSQKEDKDSVKQENGEAASATTDKSEDGKDTVDEEKQDQTDGIQF